ncbi:MAG TPA: TonB family protein [Pyrinomonadaceae bacterium]|nr:TonB family protein [Pyrinomonadaceae bacterium]
MKKYFVCFLAFVLLIGAGSFDVRAQAQDFKTLRDQGVGLYKKGEFRDALDTLARAARLKESATDAEFWNYLGLSYLEQDKEKDALKSLEKAVKIAPQTAVYHANLAFVYLMGRKINKAQAEVEKAIAIDPNSANAYYISGTANLWEGKHEKAFADAEKAISVNNKYSPAYVLKADVFIYEFGKGWTEKTPLKENLQWLVKAKELLETCEKDCARDANFKDAHAKLDTVTAFYEHFKKKADYENGMPRPANTAASNDPNRTPLKIVYRPRPNYTDRARRNNVSGTITLAVVFSADKQISQILVLTGLGYGLNEEAIRAAQSIGFEPETENGKPVTVVKTVQFSFTIY